MKSLMYPSIGTVNLKLVLKHTFIYVRVPSKLMSDQICTPESETATAQEEKTLKEKVFECCNK